MSDEFIMQMRPLFGAEEKAAICSYMDEDIFITEFKRTKIFEDQIAAFTGAKHCVVTNNGTVSLTLAALSQGVKAGDEVIVPNYTMVATPNSVNLFGATPVFVDVERSTLCLDFEKTRAAITPKTKAIMLVSANGRYPSAGIAAFERLAADYNLALIEDAAQALGSFYPDGRHIGRAGRVGSFSFSAPKIISTGQGGALITDCDETADKIRRLKDFGRAEGGTDVHDSIGYNFKFTELQACIGIEQMKKLPDRIVQKKNMIKKYREYLDGLPQVKLFENDDCFTAPWFIDAIVEKRDELVAYLKSHNIGTRTMYPPLNAQKAYDVPGSHPVSEWVGANGLWLPSSVQLKHDEIAYICNKIRAFYEA